MDQNKNIFIVKGPSIKTDFPAGFFGNTQNASDSLQITKGYSEPADSGKNTTGSRIENKLYEIGAKANEVTSGKATLAGFIRDDKTGELLAGVSVITEGKDATGITTDQFGFYSISLQKGRHTINIQSGGKQDTRRHIMLYSDGKLNIDLHDHIISLRAVVISARKSSHVSNVQLGVERLNIKTIKQTPIKKGIFALCSRE